MVTRFIEAWLLPPGLLIVLLTVAGIVLVRSVRGVRADAVATRPGTAGLIAWAMIGMAAVLYLGSTGWVSRALIGTLEREQAGSATRAHVEAVVVLGGGLTVLASKQTYPPSVSFSPDRLPAQIPPEALSRLVDGVLFADRYDLPLVVSGGRVFAGNGPAEATVAGELARRLADDSVDVLVESESRNTAENARRVAERIPERSIALVTSAYHMPRARRSFERNGFTVYPVATAYRADRRPFHAAMLLPSADGFRDTVTWLRELLGLLWYTVRRM